jgi:hypothetical protein
MDTEIDTETDTETNMETDTDMVKDTDMELEYFAKFPIRHYSCYSAVCITCDTSWRNFQQHYQLVAPFINEKYDMLILRNSYRNRNFSPNDVLEELEISVWGLKKGQYQKHVQ